MNDKQIKKILLSIGLCIFIYFFSVIQLHNKVIQLSIDNDNLENTYNLLKEDTKYIKSEIEKLLSLNNLEDLAKEKNFKKPTKEQVVMLANDKN